MNDLNQRINKLTTTIGNAQKEMTCILSSYPDSNPFDALFDPIFVMYRIIKEVSLEELKGLYGGQND